MNFFNRLPIISSICLICLAGLVGCGSGKNRDATVQGTVTLDGELSKSGTVVFHPSDDVPAAYGTVRRDGTFALRIGQGNTRNLDHSKIYPGSYVATVAIRGPSTHDEELGESAPPKPGARLSAARYGNKKTSGLVYTIEPGMNVINIAVESPSEEELLEATAELGSETPDTDIPDSEEQPAGEEESSPDVVESSTEESSL